MIAKFAKKINEILIQKGIVQKEDAELYQYGIENGIVVAGNLLASGIFGIVTGRPGLVLVFLLFYASLRSYSGGSHCKSRIGCFLISMAILSIPVYTHEFVMNNVPATVILMIGIAAVVVILILSPVESINKPLDDEEKKYYATLNDRELRLAKYALHQFRNKLLAEGKPAEDVNELLLKLWK